MEPVNKVTVKPTDRIPDDMHEPAADIRDAVQADGALADTLPDPGSLNDLPRAIAQARAEHEELPPLLPAASRLYNAALKKRDRLLAEYEAWKGGWMRWLTPSQQVMVHRIIRRILAQTAPRWWIQHYSDDLHALLLTAIRRDIALAGEPHMDASGA